MTVNEAVVNSSSTLHSGIDARSTSQRSAVLRPHTSFIHSYVATFRVYRGPTCSLMSINVNVVCYAAFPLGGCIMHYHMSVHERLQLENGFSDLVLRLHVEFVTGGLVLGQKSQKPRSPGLTMPRHEWRDTTLRLLSTCTIFKRNGNDTCIQAYKLQLKNKVMKSSHVIYRFLMTNTTRDADANLTPKIQKSTSHSSDTKIR